MHKVQKQIINANYHDEAGVDKFYDQALHLFYQDLQPEMERILSKHSLQDELVNINNLTVNLGITYESDLRKQWINRFREEFENELVRKINRLKIGQGEAGESIKSITSNELDILFFFLASGTLPWNEIASEANINALFDRLLARIPSEVEKRIHAESNKEIMIDRLVFQFSDKQIESLIKVMQPTESSFIIKSAAELRKSQRKNRIVISGNQEFRDAIWKFMLTYIINQRGSYFNTREFLADVLYNMAMHFNITLDWLIQEIFKSIQLLEIEPVHFRLGMILQDIYKTQHSGDSIPAGSDIQHQRIKLFLLKGELHAKGEYMQTSAYSTLFVDWMKSSPLEVHAFLRENSQIDLLRRITEVFPDAELQRLIKLLAPAEASFVIVLKTEIVSQQEKHHWVQAGSKQFNEEIWIILLDIILNDRGSFFNQKMFVIKTLEGLSSHFNLHASFFIEQIISLLDRSPQQFNSTYLFDIFVEIKGDKKYQFGKKPLTEEARIKYHFESLAAIVLKKTNPFTNESSYPSSDVSFIQKEIIESLIENNPVELRNWINANLKTEEEINSFVQVLGVKSNNALLTLMNNSFSKRLPELLNIFLQFNQKKSTIAYSISESELYQAAFLFLLTSRQAINSEVDLISFIIRHLAGVRRIEESLLVKFFLEESEGNKNGFPERTRQFLEKEFKIDHIAQKVIQKHKNQGAAKIDKSQSHSDFEKVENKTRTLSFETPVVLTADELNKWLQQKMKTIQILDLKSLHKLLAFYFSKIQENNWEEQCFHVFSLMDLLSKFSFVNKSFLSNYLVDFQKILLKGKTDYQGINSDWLKTRVLLFWSLNKHFSQPELTTFLFGEIAKKTKASVSTLSAELFENAHKIKRGLNSTLILDLAKNNEKPLLKISEVEHVGKEEIQIEKPLEKPTEEPEDDDSKSIYITNAGLVLLSPFISVLFERAGLTHEGTFINEEKRQYGIHLLQYCVNNDEKNPEYMLTLPKLLCGDDLTVPIKKEVQIKKKDKELINSLLLNIIAQWKMIGETSVEGLQQTFISRNGVLRSLNNQWELEVEPRSFDMLIDHLPWSFSHIKLPWMKKIIFTKWR